MKKLLALLLLISSQAEALPCNIDFAAEKAQEYFVSTFHEDDQELVWGGISSKSFFKNNISDSIYRTFELSADFFDNDPAEFFIYLHFEGLTAHHGDTTYMVSVLGRDCKVSEGYLLYEE